MRLERFEQRRAHLDGASAGVGLRQLARHEDALAREVQVPAAEAAEFVDPQAGEHEHGDRRPERSLAPLGTLRPQLAASHLAHQDVAHAAIAGDPQRWLGRPANALRSPKVEFEALSAPRAEATTSRIMKLETT